jgi:hypothetical protein
VLVSGVASQQFIRSCFPFEHIYAYSMTEKVTGSLRLSFEEQWGYKTTRTHFDKERILAAENFHLVWWKRLRETRKDFSKLHRMWLTQQVSEFGRTNRQLTYWNAEVDPQFPDCGDAEEYTMYMTRCQHPGRKKML